jgi:thiol-disulfide isomerase/thioredoxin
MKTHLLRGLLAAVLVVTAACSRPGGDAARADAAEAGLKPAAQRNPAPDFVLKDAGGRDVKLSDLKGKVVLLNFWATWCGPCKFEIPWFIEFEKQYKDQGFAVVGVSLDDEGWEVVKPYIEDKKVNYRVVVGTEEVSMKYGGVESLPSTFMIDREGRIASVHIGLQAKSAFEDDIKTLLQ